MRSTMSARPRTRAIRAVLEPLEARILMTWIGATTGNSNDAAHLYNNTANWAGGVIDNSFSGVTLAGDTTLFFNAGLTTGAGGLNLGYSGNFNLTLESSSTTTETLTLAGGISGTFGGSSVTIGDPANNLNLALGAVARTFTISPGNTLSILNVMSGTGSLTENGGGTLTLAGANTSFGGVTLSAGQLNINSATALGTGRLTINGGTIDNTSGGRDHAEQQQRDCLGRKFHFCRHQQSQSGHGGGDADRDADDHHDGGKSHRWRDHFRRIRHHQGGQWHTDAVGR